jgi:signal transduction histidine kinase
LQIEAVGRLVGNDPAAAAVRLRRLKATLPDAVVEVRRLVDGLRPPALDELGLVDAIEQHVAAMPGVDTGPTISVETATPLPDLPAAVEVAAYRIATEAALNAIRHADARTCHIGLRFDGSLRLEIIDDGRGGGDGNHSGVGLQSMRERAAELGDACVITPADPVAPSCGPVSRCRRHEPDQATDRGGRGPSGVP